MTIPRSSRYRPSPNVLFNELSDGEAVLLDLDSEEYFGLNEIGSLVWNVINVGGDLDVLVEELSAATSEPANVIRTDIDSLVSELVSAGLVQQDGQ